jgi:hypothetical protein
VDIIDELDGLEILDVLDEGAREILLFCARNIFIFLGVVGY